MVTFIVTKMVVVFIATVELDQINYAIEVYHCDVSALPTDMRISMDQVDVYLLAIMLVPLDLRGNTMMLV